MKLSKTGPDGFPVEFYKVLWPGIAPTFYRMVSYTKESGILSPYMNSANNCLLLKLNKDPMLPSNYRPISLINVDVKIICQVLAERLEKNDPLHHSSWSERIY